MLLSPGVKYAYEVRRCNLSRNGSGLLEFRHSVLPRLIEARVQRVAVLLSSGKPTEDQQLEYVTVEGKKYLCIEFL